ncbi:CD48 antigen isoform X2 [Clupea harengus]|uniref:CD48 antigen isoform X2 n=1 Tax=Clupea harengus TaxID=7950 RepID=A0A6P8FGS5_CLUHA|nr:CD48 antigen isoform X2 [Clupea harengus]
MDQHRCFCPQWCVSNHATGEISNALFAQTNGSITLKTNKQQIQEILWKCDGHKIVDWDMNSTPIEFRQFKGRTALVPETGDLTIFGLKVEDSGAYEAEAVIEGIIHSVKHKVEIIDPVSKPIITCMESNDTSFLHCQAEGPHLSYSWSGPGLTTEMNGQIGPDISKVETNSLHTCVVKNPVSEKDEHYQAADCFLEEESEKPGLSGTIITLVAILSVLLLALAVALVVLYVLKRRIPKVKSNPEEMNQVHKKKDGQEGQESVTEVPCEKEGGGDQTEVKSLLVHSIMDSPSMQHSGIPPYCLE